MHGAKDGSFAWQTPWQLDGCNKRLGGSNVLGTVDIDNYTTLFKLQMQTDLVVVNKVKMPILNMNNAIWKTLVEILLQVHYASQMQA